MKLHFTDIRPFVRRVGIANGFSWRQTVRAYDHCLLIAMEGGGIVTIDGQAYVPKTADVFLIEPNVPYCVQLQPNQRMVVIRFDWTMQSADHHHSLLVAAEENYDPSQIIQKMDLSGIFPFKPYVAMHTTYDNVELAQAMATKDYMVNENQDSRDLRLSGMMMQFLAELISPKPTMDARAEKIYEYICKNYAYPLTLQQLSEEFHFHATYINRLLSGQYGQSFRQLLIRVRLRQAALLLDNPELSVQEIGTQVGFYDYKHFQQSFKKHYGVTPAQYRHGFVSVFP
jgi:AraC-like DNA-binding protein